MTHRPWGGWRLVLPKVTVSGRPCERRSEGRGGRRCRLPLVGKQLGQPILRIRADVFEDVAQVSEGINAYPFARRD